MEFLNDALCQLEKNIHQPRYIINMDELKLSEKLLIAESKHKVNNVDIKNLIVNYYNLQTFRFINSHVDISAHTTQIISSNNNFSIAKLPFYNCNAIINLQRINDIRRINKFFELLNTKLPRTGIFIGCCETLDLRCSKLKNKYPYIINHIVLFTDYIFKRVFPKLPVTKKLYFSLTGGRNRLISRPETLGRLYSCGFEVIDEQTIGNLFFFAVKKIDEPAYDPRPSYGLLFPMVRTGKNGKIIRVYKIRTMYAFSEYLQAYVYTKNKLEQGGKFKNDFRVTKVGKFMRKFWIDELPMIYNLFKGELKLVGVRPLSKHFLSLYPDDLVELRHTVKPGLVPPFYADMPFTLDEIVESEKKYILEYKKAPLRTDWKYFWKAFNNIIFRKARSK